MSEEEMKVADEYRIVLGEATVRADSLQEAKEMVKSMTKNMQIAPLVQQRKIMFTKWKRIELD